MPPVMSNTLPSRTSPSSLQHHEHISNSMVNGSVDEVNESPQPCQRLKVKQSAVYSLEPREKSKPRFPQRDTVQRCAGSSFVGRRHEEVPIPNVIDRGASAVEQCKTHRCAQQGMMVLLC